MWHVDIRRRISAEGLGREPSGSSLAPHGSEGKRGPTCAFRAVLGVSGQRGHRREIHKRNWKRPQESFLVFKEYQLFQKLSEIFF